MFFVVYQIFQIRLSNLYGQQNAVYKVLKFRVFPEIFQKKIRNFVKWFLFFFHFIFKNISKWVTYFHYHFSLLHNGALRFPNRRFVFQLPSAILFYLKGAMLDSSGFPFLAFSTKCISSTKKNDLSYSCFQKIWIMKDYVSLQK